MIPFQYLKVALFNNMNTMDNDHVILGIINSPLNTTSRVLKTKSSYMTLNFLKSYQILFKWKIICLDFKKYLFA